MSNPIASVRALLIYAICLPLAVFLGYLLAGPMDNTSFVVFGLVLFVLVLPLFFKWHHVWLIASWNLCMTLYGLPGLPPAWFLMAFVSFFIGLGHHILNRDKKYLETQSVTRAVIFIAIVVLVTAQLTGGIGMKLFGSSAYGGKRYVYIGMAILGYFAFIGQPIPAEKRKLYVTLFLLSGVTQVIGELFSFVNPNFYYIFLFFPADFAGYFSLREDIPRLAGLAVGASAVIYAMLARYGVAESFSLRSLWRPVLLTACLVLSTLGGFRSLFVTIGLVFAVLFYLEGLVRTILMPILLIVMLAGGVLCFGFADRLPVSVQRTLSFLPINVSVAVRESAESSSDWRFQMWRRVLPDVPRYLILGKGFSFSGEELEVMTAAKNGLNPTASVELAGDYHNGPLSLIIPFGIWGAVGFLWFVAASVRALRANYLYGEADCRRINRFLLAFFLVKAFAYFFIFGSFQIDFAQFVGIIGLSVSLNGGVAKKPALAVQPLTPQNRTRFPLFPKPEAVPGKS